MAATIVIEVAGLEKVIAILDKLENPRWDALLEIIGQTVEEQSIAHFEGQGGPEGAWATRTRSYPWPILLRPPTKLRDSIGHKVLGGNQVAIGTNVYYGRYHQEGTSRMVRRAFLGLTEGDKEEVTSVIENYIESLLA